MCEHKAFESQVSVARCQLEEGGPITHYSAEVIVRCSECKQYFQFIGMPIGMSAYQPTRSMDGFQLRAPIILPGAPPQEGIPSFIAYTPANDSEPN